MEQLQRLYANWIGNATLALVSSGVLLAGSILAFFLGETAVAEDLGLLVRQGDQIFGLFVSALLVLVFIGWRFDNQPGRTLVVALIAALVGSIIRMLFPLASSGGWLPVWSGIFLGIFIVTLYMFWRVGARFALVTVVMILYTMLVTAGLVLGIEPAVSAPLVFGLATVGGFAFCLACVVCERINANIRAAKRDAPEQHIGAGAQKAFRSILFWGAAALLITFPGAVMGTGAMRSLGLLLCIGAMASVYTMLIFPVPLELVSGRKTVSQETDRSGRRESRRRR